jgi:hypothetical protein
VNLTRDNTQAVQREFNYEKKSSVTVLDFKKKVAKEMNCDASNLIAYQST